MISNAHVTCMLGQDTDSDAAATPSQVQPDLQVCRLEPWLPGARALHLCGNHMSTFNGPASSIGEFSNLQVSRSLGFPHCNERDFCTTLHLATPSTYASLTRCK